MKTPQGKKRKFDPLVNKDEKAKSLKVLEQINSKKAKIDVTKAVGRKLNSDENEHSEEKKSKKGGKGGKKGQQKHRNRGTFGGKKKGGGKPGGGGKFGGKSGGKPGGKPGGGAKFSGKAGAKKGGKSKQGRGSGVKK